MKSALQPKTLKEKNKRVYDAYVKACGDQKLAGKALIWGEYPSVGVAQGLIRVNGKTMCGMNPPSFFNQNSNVVLVSDVRIWPLEACVWEGDLLKNKRRFECTLLHEIVHWVRMKAGLSDEDFDNFPDAPTEAGEQFEIWAYGDLLCSNDEIDDAASSIF
jgi:hypothetical protein